MSNNVFFSPNKPVNIYATNQSRIIPKTGQTNLFSDIRKPNPPQYEYSEKPPPFSEAKKITIFDSSQKFAEKPPVRHSFSQNPKGASDLKQIQNSNAKNFEPINNNHFNYSSSKSPLRLNPFNKSYLKSASPETGEKTMIDSLLNNQTNHNNKIKQLEKVQNLRSRAFEENVFNSAKAKEDQLNLLIEKRISEKLQKDDKFELEKNFKIEQQKKELKNYIEEQIGAKSPDPKNTEKNTENWRNFRMIEEMRKKNSKSPNRGEIKQDLEANAKKFFGIDDEEQELPGTSTLKYDTDNASSPLRYGKTSVRNTTYDPITDSVNTYQNMRKNPRGLGARKVDDLPDKINSVSHSKNNEYYSSRNKAFEISNPLTGEVKVMQKIRMNNQESEYKYYIK